MSPQARQAVLIDSLKDTLSWIRNLPKEASFATPDASSRSSSKPAVVVASTARSGDPAADALREDVQQHSDLASASPSASSLGVRTSSADQPPQIAANAARAQHYTAGSSPGADGASTAWNRAAFSVVVRGLLIAGEVDAAERVIDLMILDGARPTSRTFTAIISHHLRQACSLIQFPRVRVPGQDGFCSRRAVPEGITFPMEDASLTATLSHLRTASRSFHRLCALNVKRCGSLYRTMLTWSMRVCDQANIWSSSKQSSIHGSPTLLAIKRLSNQLWQEVLLDFVQHYREGPQVYRVFARVPLSIVEGAEETLDDDDDHHELDDDMESDDHSVLEYQPRSSSHEQQQHQHRQQGAGHSARGSVDFSSWSPGSAVSPAASTVGLMLERLAAWSRDAPESKLGNAPRHPFSGDQPSSAAGDDATVSADMSGASAADDLGRDSDGADSWDAGMHASSLSDSDSTSMSRVPAAALRQAAHIMASVKPRHVSMQSTLLHSIVSGWVGLSRNPLPIARLSAYHMYTFLLVNGYPLNALMHADRIRCARLMPSKSVNRVVRDAYINAQAAALQGVLSRLPHNGNSMARGTRMDTRTLAFEVASDLNSAGQASQPLPLLPRYVPTDGSPDSRHTVKDAARKRQLTLDADFYLKSLRTAVDIRDGDLINIICEDIVRDGLAIGSAFWSTLARLKSRCVKLFGRDKPLPALFRRPEVKDHADEETVRVMRLPLPAALSKLKVLPVPSAESLRPVKSGQHASSSAQTSPASTSSGVAAPTAIRLCQSSVHSLRSLVRSRKPLPAIKVLLSIRQQGFAAEPSPGTRFPTIDPAADDATRQRALLELENLMESAYCIAIRACGELDRMDWAFGLAKLYNADRGAALRLSGLNGDRRGNVLKALHQVVCEHTIKRYRGSVETDETTSPTLVSSATVGAAAGSPHLSVEAAEAGSPLAEPTDADDRHANAPSEHSRHKKLTRFIDQQLTAEAHVRQGAATRANDADAYNLLRSLFQGRFLDRSSLQLTMRMYRAIVNWSQRGDHHHHQQQHQQQQQQHQQQRGPADWVATSLANGSTFASLERRLTRIVIWAKQLQLEEAKLGVAPVEAGTGQAGTANSPGTRSRSTDWVDQLNGQKIAVAKLIHEQVHRLQASAGPTSTAPLG